MERKMKFIIVAVALAVFAGSAQATPVGPYRLAFTTGASYNAMSSDIATYNAIMQAEADAAGIGAGSGLGDGDTSWFIIGSTATVDARDNTGTNPDVSTGVPIYLVDGTTLVASDNADLWDGEIDHAIDQTATGGSPAHLWVFTGTAYDGTAGAGTGYPGVPPRGPEWGPLGDTGVEIQQGCPAGSRPGATLNSWIDASFSGNDVSDSPGKTLTMYAMSEVIPEPATMSLLALGGLGLFRRRRNR